MNRSGQELLYDTLILLAAGLAHTSYMLGIGVDPLPTLIIGTGLIGIGVVTVVPRSSRVPAAVTGGLGMILAGAVVPRYAARAARPGETLWLSLLLAGMILLLTFTALRLTTFRAQATQTA